MRQLWIKRGLLIWQVVWPVLFYIALTVGLILLTGNSLDGMVILVLAASATSVILVYCYRRRERGGMNLVGTSGQIKLNRGQTVLLIAVLACAASILFNNLIELIGLLDMSDAYEEMVEASAGVPLWLEVLSSGLAAPVVEELIYRGMGYARLRSVMGIAPAAVISSLLFGLTHGNLVQAVYGFAMGILLALAYEYLGGIMAAIWFHIVANMSSVGTELAGALFPDFFETGGCLIGGILVPALVLAGGIFLLHGKKRREQPLR